MSQPESQGPEPDTEADPFESTFAYLNALKRDPRDEDPEGAKYLPTPDDPVFAPVERFRLQVYLRMGEATPLLDQFLDLALLATGFPDPCWFRGLAWVEGKMEVLGDFDPPRQAHGCRVWYGRWLLDLSAEEGRPYAHRRAAVLAVAALILCDSRLRTAFRDRLHGCSRSWPDLAHLLTDVADGVEVPDGVRMIREARHAGESPAGPDEHDGPSPSKDAYLIVFGEVPGRKTRDALLLVGSRHTRLRLRTQRLDELKTLAKGGKVRHDRSEAGRKRAKRLFEFLQGNAIECERRGTNAGAEVRLRDPLHIAESKGSLNPNEDLRKLLDRRDPGQF